jgi:hypothetical protein
MIKSPLCPLCSAVTVRESNVWVQTGGSNCLQYTLAWVCSNCSTAYPIAVTAPRLFGRMPEPLYEGGLRREA